MLLVVGKHEFMNSILVAKQCTSAIKKDVSPHVTQSCQRHEFHPSGEAMHVCDSEGCVTACDSKLTKTTRVETQTWIVTQTTAFCHRGMRAIAAVNAVA